MGLEQTPVASGEDALFRAIYQTFVSRWALAFQNRYDTTNIGYWTVGVVVPKESVVMREKHAVFLLTEMRSEAVTRAVDRIPLRADTDIVASCDKTIGKIMSSIGAKPKASQQGPSQGSNA